METFYTTLLHKVQGKKCTTNKAYTVCFLQFTLPVLQIETKIKKE